MLIKKKMNTVISSWCEEDPTPPTNMFKNLPVPSQKYRGFVLPARINGHKVPTLALFDSGADVSLVAEEVIDDLPEKMRREVMATMVDADRANIVTASNSSMNIKGMVKLSVVVGRQKTPRKVDAYLVPGLVPPMILGHKSLATMNAQLRFTLDEEKDSCLIICDEGDNVSAEPPAKGACTMYRMKDVMNEFRAQQAQWRSAMKGCDEPSFFTLGAVTENKKQGWPGPIYQTIPNDYKVSRERRNYNIGFDQTAVGFHRKY